MTGKLRGLTVLGAGLALVCAVAALCCSQQRASAAPVVLFSDDFESAFSGWTTTGKPIWYSGSPRIGSHAVKVPKNSSIQRTVSTVGWQDITVSVWLGADLSRSGATFRALWFDGATWAVLKEFRTGDLDADGQLHYFEFSLPSAAANDSRFALRFRLSSKAPGDAGYVDNVVVAAGNRFMCTLTLAGAGGQVKVNGGIQALPWSGAFDYGTSVVLQAVADPGNHFTSWSGALSSTDNPVFVLMDGEKAVTAGFAVDSYRLAVGSGTGHGSIKVDGVLQSLPWVGTFDRGASVLLEAVPDVGYHFTGWAGGLTGNTNPAFITMEGDQSVSLGFASDTYVLLLSGVGGGVKVNGVYHALPDSVILPYNSTLILEAAPADGWHFTGWSGDVRGAESPTALFMDSDKSVSVEFALDEHMLNLSGIGSGSAKVDGEDVALPWSGVFSHGDVVVLEAVPGAGAHFTCWSGDLSGAANPTWVVVDATKNIVASFALNTYTLTIAGTNGSVKVNGALKALPWSGPFAAGELVNLEAIPAQGYHFVSWSGALTGSANPTAIAMDGDRLVLAEFAVNSYTLSVTGVHGTLMVDDVAETVPYSASYDYGAVVTLEAVPDVGYEFVGWSGDLTGTANPLDITIAGDMAVVANFRLGHHSLSLSGAGGMVKVDGVARALPWVGQYDYGSVVELEAAPDSCMRFLAWSGDLLGRESPVTLTMDTSKNITAEFSSIVVFRDVACDFWAVAEVAACYYEGIVQGFPDGSYQPTLPISRDQMGVYISRALAGGDAGVPEGPAQSTFSDVGVDHWAFKYVEFAAANHVVVGYPDGSYQPAATLDRAQMAAFIARAIVTPTGDQGLVGYTPPAAPSFPDVAPDHWAYRYIEYIADPARGVTKGYPDGLYHPESPCTRDQMAVYVQRAFQLPL